MKTVPNSSGCYLAASFREAEGKYFFNLKMLEDKTREEFARDRGNSNILHFPPGCWGNDPIDQRQKPIKIPKEKSICWEPGIFLTNGFAAVSLYLFLFTPFLSDRQIFDKNRRHLTCDHGRVIGSVG